MMLNERGTQKPLPANARIHLSLRVLQTRLEITDQRLDAVIMRCEITGGPYAGLQFDMQTDAIMDMFKKRLNWRLATFPDLDWDEAIWRTLGEFNGWEVVDP